MRVARDYTGCRIQEGAVMGCISPAVVLQCFAAISLSFSDYCKGRLGSAMNHQYHQEAIKTCICSLWRAVRTFDAGEGRHILVLKNKHWVKRRSFHFSLVSVTENTSSAPLLLESSRLYVCCGLYLMTKSATFQVQPSTPVLRASLSYWDTSSASSSSVMALTGSHSG